MRAKITKRTVDAAQPMGATYLIRDTDVKGFVLVVTPAGAKSYAVDYRVGSGRGSPKRRLTIGKHGSPWTPEMARAEAKRLLAEVAAGRDPAMARQADRKALTFDELINLYLGEGVGHKKPSTLKADRGRIEHHLRPLLGKLRADRLARADVERVRNAVTAGKTAQKIENGEKRPSGSMATGGKGVAAQCVTLVSAIFAFAIERGLCADNPARGVKKALVRRVERFLSEAEIARLAVALNAEEARTGNPLSLGSDQAATADRMPSWRDRQPALGTCRLRARMPPASRQQDRRQSRIPECARASAAGATAANGGQPARDPRREGRECERGDRQCMARHS